MKKSIDFEDVLVVKEDPLSTVVYNSINMSFVLAHSFASLWITAHGKNTDLDALKAR